GNWWWGVEATHDGLGLPDQPVDERLHVRPGPCHRRANDVVGPLTHEALAEGSHQPAPLHETAHQATNPHADALAAQGRPDHLLVTVEAERGAGLEIGTPLRGQPRAPVEKAEGAVHVQQHMMLQVFERAQGVRAAVEQGWAADGEELLAE